MRKEVYGERNKPMCLMDLGTMGGKYLKKTGVLKNLDESDEINACSVRITVDNNGKDEPWLLLFKNETHNHPPRSSPSAARPLHRRRHPRPAGQPRLCVSGHARHRRGRSAGACAGHHEGQTAPAQAGHHGRGGLFQLRQPDRPGLGMVDELYHPGYIAKRMEIGAVVGAVPEENVRREEPVPGDVVIPAGRPHRRRCGGATGSSRPTSWRPGDLRSRGAEGQRPGGALKLQRLFRTKEATLMIKRCNDFGAGGVSVAIGELADGLSIDLNAVPRKYDGLDGTELAISESQERMAVVVAKEDADKFIAAANKENLEATVVATVTESPSGHALERQRDLPTSPGRS